MFDLRQGRPEILEVNGRAVLARADRFGRKIDIRPARQRVGYHERWGHEEIRFDVLVHPGFEIAVARKHRGHHQIVLNDGFLDGLRQGPGVADARHTPVASQVES